MPWMLFQQRFSSIIIICWPEADYLVKKDFDLYLSKTFWLKNCCFKHTYYNYNSWLEFMLHRYIDLQLRYFAWIACAANCQLPDNSEIKTIKRTKWLFEYVIFMKPTAVAICLPFENFLSYWSHKSALRVIAESNYQLTWIAILLTCLIAPSNSKCQWYASTSQTFKNAILSSNKLKGLEYTSMMTRLGLLL